jgi:hypothetical protein
MRCCVQSVHRQPMHETTIMKATNLILKAAIALAITAPLVANAESAFTTGAGSPITATAHLDFQIIIPKVLFLQVGTGTANAANATINQIAFTVPAVNVGDASVINASAASGDLGNGQVTARVIGNNGTVTFTSTTAGALGNGAGDTISYAQIAATVLPNTSAVALAHPTLVDGATTTVTLTPASGKVMNRDAKWTFTYLNSAVVAPGTYGGTNVNNSRVTYTASMP